MQVIIAKNSFEPDTWETFETDDLCKLLTEQFDSFPETARIYRGDCHVSNDVTPTCEADIEALQKMAGPFTVVVYPEWAYVPYIIMAIVAVAAIAMMPNVPAVVNRNMSSPSPNNELSQRTNRPRPNDRIPDIFGAVRSTPDLIQLPYSVYENHQQIEYCYMCVGRGDYDIFDVRDGQTPITEIDGTGVTIYRPNTSPNFTGPYAAGTEPIVIGDAITEPLYRVDRSKSINGQVLKAPNESDLEGNGEFAFYPSGKIRVSMDSALAANFDVGSTITINGTSLVSSYSEGTGDNTQLIFFIGWSLDGTYTISAINTIDSTTFDIVLSSPATVNPYWNYVEHIYGATFGGGEGDPGNPGYPVNIGLSAYGRTAPVTGTPGGTAIAVVFPEGRTSTNQTYYMQMGYIGVITLGHTVDGSDNWVGPYTVDISTMRNFIANFVATNGMYKDDGTAQLSTSVQIQLEMTPLNSGLIPSGSPVLYTITVTGSATVKTTRAATFRAPANFTATKARFRARRLTPRDTAYSGQVMDEVQWKDLYALTPITVSNFGNVTTIQTKTVATERALSVSERQLNLLATRKVPRYMPGTNTFNPAYPTRKAAEIIFAIATDPYIGNRTLAEIDVVGIWTTYSAINTYFGTADAGDFCYTFDQNNVSFEETMRIVCNAIFCVPYRQGNLIKIFFEKARTDSTLLFNHRNKIPGSEKRTVTFGRQSEYDCIEYQYVSNTDDAVLTKYVPMQNPNPKRIESVGIRNDRQAHFHAWREWQRLAYHHTTVEFDALQEAEILTINDRILVADNTRSLTQDGEVVSKTSFTLELSQRVTFKSGKTYTIFLQGVDGSVESLGVSPASGSAPITTDTVLLSGAPTVTLSLAANASVRTLYWIVENTDVRTKAFLVTERTPNDSMTSKVQAINYAPEYYSHDTDYITHVIS